MNLGDRMDIFHMTSAWMLSQHSNCCSKKVGAILVVDNRIISSGYNGTRSGWKNCIDHARDEGWLIDGHYLRSDKRHLHREWSMINEYHAEANTLDTASRNGFKIEGSTLFVNISPCVECCKRIANSGVVRLVYSEEYDFSSNDWKLFLEENGVVIDKIGLDAIKVNSPYINTDELKFDTVKEI